MDDLLLSALLRDIDRNGPVPLYHQLAQSLEAAIRTGDAPAGTLLANEVELSTRLYLSRRTVRHAIQQLADKGLVERRRGTGTYIV